jgi:hypothetical protein
VAWILEILIGGGISGAVGSGFKSEFNLPDVESKHGMDILKAKFEGDGAGSSGTIVFQSKDGFDDAEKAQLQTFLNSVAKVEKTTVQSPFVPAGATQVSTRDGAEGTIAYARIEVPRQLDQEEGKAYAEKVQKAQPHIDGVRIDPACRKRLNRLRERVEQTNDVVEFCVAANRVLPNGAVLRFADPAPVLEGLVALRTARLRLALDVRGARCSRYSRLRWGALLARFVLAPELPQGEHEQEADTSAAQVSHHLPRKNEFPIAASTPVT